MHNTIKLSLSLLTLASTLLVSTTAGAVPCTVTEQTQFFANFGDPTHTDDGAGSVDDPAASLYAAPALLMANVATWWGNGIARSDEPMADAAHPIVLDGYAPFSAPDVDWAIVRIDFYFTHASNTEGIAFLDEVYFSGSYATFAYYDRLRAVLIDAGEDRDQWISMRIDLLTGNAFASEIDAYGNPIADYGTFATFGDDPGDFGLLEDVLDAASDGDLYPLFYDDMELSYAALYGMESITYTNYYCGAEA